MSDIQDHHPPIYYYFYFKLALISLYALHSGLVADIHKGDDKPLKLNELTTYVGDMLKHMYKKTGERTPGKSPRTSHTSRTPARTSTGRPGKQVYNSLLASDGSDTDNTGAVSTSTSASASVSATGSATTRQVPPPSSDEEDEEEDQPRSEADNEVARNSDVEMDSDLEREGENDARLQALIQEAINEDY